MASGLAWSVSRLCGRPLGLRSAMRWGMGLGFIVTGVDHFVSAASRYAPMIPDALAAHAMVWVYLTGMAELAGGLALVVPVALSRRLGWPRLRRHAGIALAALLTCVVVANVNVALKGQQVEGLAFGAWYYWIRPLFQPVFIAWVLWCTAVPTAPHRAAAEA